MVLKVCKRSKTAPAFVFDSQALHHRLVVHETFSSQITTLKKTQKFTEICIIYYFGRSGWPASRNGMGCSRGEQVYFGQGT